MMEAPAPAATAPSPAPDAVGTVRRRVDPRLPAYVVAGFTPLIAAMVTGSHALAAFGAPFLVLAVIGLARRGSPALRGEVRLRADRALEGGAVRGEVHLEWEGELEIDVTLSGTRGVTPVDPAPVVGWSLPAGRGPVTLPFTLRAHSWGVHELGTLWVRVHRPGSLTFEERAVASAPSIRVLPTELRLSRMLKPVEPRALAGRHISRLRGHGTDFAELRPYRPGDRLRDVSWGTTARLGTPWVTVHHTERTGTVLLVLDAVFRDERRSTEALARAARAAWAVASVHLRAQDRVGLFAQGRTTAWLPPRGGRRARWMLLDELLTVGGAAADTTRSRRRGTRAMVPADALVVGVSSLRSQTFSPELLRYRRYGHPTVALVIDTTDLLPEPEGHADAAARRIWLAQREAERHALERGGVPTALVTSADGVGAAILTLRRRMGPSQVPRRMGVAP